MTIMDGLILRKSKEGHIGTRYHEEVVFLYCQVFVYVSVVMVFLHASGLLYKFKRRDRESSLPKPFLFLIALADAAAVAFGIWFLVSLIGG